MRLTLRTLLAYMDDILEPEDAQEIAKKIADSPTATELMHRIRDAMRRLRLGAPSVLDRGAGLDPNTVAEYLDNTLSDAQVPDFEKVCLESDVHLAEVAACHRILALVLGESAEVDPSTRERAYRAPEALAASSDGETETGPSPIPPEVPGAAPDVAAQPPPAPAASRIPEYLRGAERAARRRRLAVGAAAVILVAAAVLLLTGRFGGRNLVGEWLGTEPSAAERPSDQGAPKGTTPGSTAEQTPAGVSEQPRAAVSEPPAPASAKTASGDTETRPAAGPSGSQAGPKGPGPRRPETPAVVPSPPPAPASPGPKPTEVVRVPSNGSDVTARGPVPPTGAPGADIGSRPSSGKEVPPAPEAPKVAQQVGYVVSTKEVLLRFDARMGDWRCLGERAEPVSGERPLSRPASPPVPPGLFAGDRLLSLPAFRPLVALGGQARVQLIGGTMVELLGPDAQSPEGLAIEYGRVLLKAEETGAARLRLQLGGQRALLSFHGVESSVAIEVQRQDSQGADPETQPGPLIADLYVTSGKIGWQEVPDQVPVELEAPIRRQWGQRAGEPGTSQQFPKWIYSDTTSLLDQRGATTLERELSGGRPANLVLRELVGFKLREVRSLAVRSLALIGDFGPLLGTLDDPDQRLYWDDCVEQLRAGVMRRPASAAAVRSAMERLYGAREGARLYEMLWKYRQPLSSADAQQLVDYLDHQVLAFRVLGLWNLKTIYGMTLQYRPEDPAVKRQVAVQRWKERLKLGLAPRGAGAARGIKAESREPLPEIESPGSGEPF